jgi:hypothetical protein
MGSVFAGVATEIGAVSNSEYGYDERTMLVTCERCEEPILLGQADFGDDGMNPSDSGPMPIGR